MKFSILAMIFVLLLATFVASAQQPVCMLNAGAGFYNGLVTDVADLATRNVKMQVQTFPPNLFSDLVGEQGFPTVAPGSLLSFLGTRIVASPTEGYDNIDGFMPRWNTLANNSELLVNGVPTPMIYVGIRRDHANSLALGEIVAQIPYGLSGSVTFQVRMTSITGGQCVGPTYALKVTPVAVGFVSFGGHVVVQAPNSVSDMPVAKAGDIVTAYAVGLGDIEDSSLVAGKAADRAIQIINKSLVSVSVGDVSAEIQYVGVTPGAPGLYQVNVRVPYVAPGQYTLSFKASTTEASTVLTVVQ